MQDPVVFLHLVEPEAADDLTAALDEAALPWKVERIKQGFDPFFRVRREYAPYVLVIEAADRNRVREVEEQLFRASATTLEPEHYLHQMSRDELTEIVAHEDEWSRRDVLRAVELLRGQGVDISDAQRMAWRSSRVLESRIPAKLPVLAVAFGLIALGLGWFLDFRALLFNIVLGLHLVFAKGRDLEGHRDFFRYTTNARIFGGLILGLSGLLFLVELWMHVYVLTQLLR